MTAMLGYSRSCPYNWQLRPKVVPAVVFVVIFALWPVGQGATEELHHVEDAINMDEHHHHTAEKNPSHGTGHGGHAEKNPSHGGGHGGLHCGMDHDGHAPKCVDDGLKSKSHVILAYVMMGFVAFNFCILYLVNSPNVFVRSATYQVLCMSISVYCAVLLNNAAMHVIAAIGEWMHKDIEITFGLVIFLGDYTVLFLLCRHFKEQHTRLMAIESLGGHLMAFAGIIAFGNMLFSCWFEKHIWETVFGVVQGHWHEVAIKYMFVIGLVSAGLLLLFHSARQWRRKHYTKRSLGSTSASDLPHTSPSATEPTQHHTDGHWVEEVTGAENEAGALILGFLVLQTSVLAVTGEQPALHDHTCYADKLSLQALYLFVIGVVLLIGLVFVSCCKTRVQKLMKNPQKKVPSFNFRRGLAMSGAYCIERSSKWLVISHWHDAQVAHVVSAFSLSLWCAAAVYLLTHSLGINNNSVLDEKDKVRADACLALFQAFAVLIGLGWDHAFEVCEEQIVQQLEGYDWPPSVSKMLLAVALCGVVIPAWKWYILPAARKPLKDHQESMDQSNEQYERLNIEDERTEPPTTPPPTPRPPPPPTTTFITTTTPPTSEPQS